MMLLPVLVHKDEDSCYGVTIPDLPGCFTAGDTLDEALANVREAAALYLEDADELPVVRPIENHPRHPDPHGGFWMVVEIDDLLLGARERAELSLPRRLLRGLDELAAQKRLSREEVVARACLAYLKNLERA